MYKIEALCMNELLLPSRATSYREVNEGNDLESDELLGTKGFGEGGNCVRELSVYNMN
jgi:hypothetical protein